MQSSFAKGLKNWAYGRVYFILPMHLNFEFKARTNDLQLLETRLQSLDPRFQGTDEQTDTYFHVPHGRLKLREGPIENALIHYNRMNSAGAKQSDVILYQHSGDAQLKEALIASLGVKVVVSKTRRIYFIGNVKFHFDEVSGLGSFIEVEAIDLSGDIGIDRLKEQCHYYAAFFGVREEDYIPDSYSDLLLHKGKEND
jgi:predicted adenylyl cyclase CyaB